MCRLSNMYSTHIVIHSSIFYDNDWQGINYYLSEFEDKNSSSHYDNYQDYECNEYFHFEVIP